jgi:hypothetical protein
MIASWRSSVLLALLFLIALILVLPQVGLPDYLSSDISFKVPAPLLVHTPANLGLDPAILVGGNSISAPPTPAISMLSPPLRPPLLLAFPELRC